ncbi:MAG: orotate phosphoribosyltransferase [Planctomycetes bacterium]|nr:orotate phosphoribosyltransferase [Planctomycetota bacterium]
MLTSAQRDFLDLLMARQALKFGDFTLKSGRKSPYFVNTGCFNRGSDIAKLGMAYADAIRRAFGDGVEVVFGPAYKGIPLALGAAQAYEQLVGHEVGWAYDRKEAKDHGDGGAFVGAPLTAGRQVVVVDDVITAGTAVRETMAKLAPLKLAVRGVVVAVDRQEKGTGAMTAVQELSQEFGVPVVATITITEAADHLVAEKRLTAVDRERIRAHLLGG